MSNNSRVRKNGPGDFTLLVASAEPHPPKVHKIESHESSTITLTVEYGDFAKPLKKVVSALAKVNSCFSLLISKRVDQLPG
jgi:dipeptidyl-peptidase-3